MTKSRLVDLISTHRSLLRLQLPPRRPLLREGRGQQPHRLGNLGRLLRHPFADLRDLGP